MRDMLEPILGETGAVVAQFVVTLIVVLALIAVVYWLVRRFAGARLGGIARGRVPRLAIVDAMAIDNRRRLVLVRRDNAEHLILIGGPSDILIEGPIRRVSARHRAEQQQAARAAIQPGEGPAAPEGAEGMQSAPVITPMLPPEPVAAPAQSPPSPPVHRAPQPPPPPPPPPGRRTDTSAATAEVTAPPAADREADVAEFKPRRTTAAIPAAANDQTAERASAQFAEIAHPTAVEPFRRSADDQASAVATEQEAAHGEQAEEGPVAATLAPPEQPVPELVERTPQGAGDGAAPAATAEDEQGEADANAGDDTAAKVSDLEREMAKLLGEIGTKGAT